MDSTTQIKCPNCGTSIDVQDILAHQLEDEIKQKYQSQLTAEKKKFEQEQEQLDKAKQEFEENKRKENELFQERIDAKLKEERKSIEEKVKNHLLRRWLWFAPKGGLKIKPLLLIF